MARALFKSWFVDFEPVRAKMEGRWRRGESLPGLPAEHYDLFPDRLVDSELGEIPEGWEVRALLGDVTTLNPESWSKANAPRKVEHVDLAHTKLGVIESTKRYNWKESPSRAKRILRPGDTLVGTVRPGNGSYALIDEDGLTGQHWLCRAPPNAADFQRTRLSCQHNQRKPREAISPRRWCRISGSSSRSCRGDQRRTAQQPKWDSRTILRIHGSNR